MRHGAHVLTQAQRCSRATSKSQTTTWSSTASSFLISPLICLPPSAKEARTPPDPMPPRIRPPTVPFLVPPLLHNNPRRASILLMHTPVVVPRAPARRTPSAPAKALRLVRQAAHLPGPHQIQTGLRQLATAAAPHTALLRMRKEDCQTAGSVVRTTWGEHITSTTTRGKPHGSGQARVSTRQISAGTWQRRRSRNVCDIRTECCQRTEREPTRLPLRIASRRRRLALPALRA